MILPIEWRVSEEYWEVAESYNEDILWNILWNFVSQVLKYWSWEKQNFVHSLWFIMAKESIFILFLKKKYVYNIS